MKVKEFFCSNSIFCHQIYRTNNDKILVTCCCIVLKFFKTKQEIKKYIINTTLPSSTRKLIEISCKKYISKNDNI